MVHMVFGDPLMTAYVLVVAFVFGLAMGSFINCWAWRSTHGESVLKGRSHCPACGHALGFLDLIPVISWLASKGRCRYCGGKVSARYPITELLCGVVFVAIVAVYGLSVETVELLAFACTLLFLSLTDLDEFVIPNGCILFALAVRAAYLAYAVATGRMDMGDVGFYVGSAFAMGVVLLVVVLIADKVFGRESMGGGDLKLFFVAGFYFGWQQGLFVVLVSCLIGILVAFVDSVLLGSKSRDPYDPHGEAAASAAAESSSKDSDSEDTEVKEDESDDGGKNDPKANGDLQQENVLHHVIPFGPSIAAACVVTMLVGKPFIDWYLSLM